MRGTHRVMLSRLTQRMHAGFIHDPAACARTSETAFAEVEARFLEDLPMIKGPLLYDLRREQQSTERETS